MFLSPGVYKCIVCDVDLFSSKHKFIRSVYDYATFHSTIGELWETQDFDPKRMSEVRCKNCGAHLGGLALDSVTQTGRNYMIKSSSLNFIHKPLPKRKRDFTFMDWQEYFIYL